MYNDIEVVSCEYDVRGQMLESGLGKSFHAKFDRSSHAVAVIRESYMLHVKPIPLLTLAIQSMLSYVLKCYVLALLGSIASPFL